jgi:uncharacterized iron-regulated protein
LIRLRARQTSNACGSTGGAVLRASAAVALLLSACAPRSDRQPAEISPEAGDAARLAEQVTAANTPDSLPYGPRGVGHPLAGSLWDVTAQREVSIDEFAALAGRSVFVLLGEQHNNAEHHLQQARVIEALAQRDRHPVVAFEMFDVDGQGNLDACYADGVCSITELRETTAWDESGWPAWEIYEPVFSAALENGVSIVAANLPKEKARTLARDPDSSESLAILEDLGVSGSASAAERAAMAEEIAEAHCGHANDAMVDGMIAAQRARDAQMAERLYLIRGVHRGTQIVLIAGFGHTRKDRGVPTWLQRLDPYAPVVSVAFIEVDDSWNDFADAADAFDGAIPFDFLGFTERADDEDPCEAFREQLEHISQ